MANIIKDEKQSLAFDTVTGNLEQIKIINKMLTEAKPLFTVSDENASRKSRLPLAAELNDKMRQVLLAQKKLYIKQINQLSKQYRIALDDVDIKIMSAVKLPEDAAGESNE